ncbi:MULTISPECIES: helix-turn-helix domain-containing protein [Xenorhabdus]|uniref:HTH cro/C1-type domain-containing protein n=1 Tax=Xenorhabdus khoisanae TaxID=880157 RepID=A0A0J5FYE8_9GAMM|nr:helix-turn-helix domain-containing protein [Xenorhabdus khoisanae]KMJ46957.1 hypothetical protein AB204_00875 [Xenorhabdus khoisanae]
MSNKLNNILELAEELHVIDTSPVSLVNDQIKAVTMMTGTEIKQLRAQHGMSQSMLAMALGMSKESVSKWEREEKKPSGPALRMLRILERLGPEVLLV